MYVSIRLVQCAEGDWGHGMKGEKHVDWLSLSLDRRPKLYLHFKLHLAFSLATVAFNSNEFECTWIRARKRAPSANS